MSTPDDTTITVTREDLLEQRRTLLNHYGLAETDMEPDWCQCCPKNENVPWAAFHGWRTLNWLLGETEDK